LLHVKNQFRKNILIENVAFGGHVLNEPRTPVPFAGVSLAASEGEVSMTTIKLLSAGLIATALLATPAMARESGVASRYVAEKANASAFPAARYFDGHVGIPAPRVGVLPAPPDGENCDVGDNPHIC
jgi:hypothetical protein